MTYTVDGVDKTAGIREKAKSICELVSNPSMLEEEREFARKNRDKFRGYSNNDGSTNMSSGGSTGQYKGFGSEDVKKYGGPDNYTPGSNYDPYKKDSIFAGTEKTTEEPRKKKKKKSKRKKSSSSDEEDDSNSDSGDGESSSEEEEV